MSTQSTDLFRPTVRFAPKEASAADIDEANAWIKGARLRSEVLPTDEAIQLASQMKGGTPAKLRGLIHHPDERVPLALLDNPGPAWKKAHTDYVHRGLSYRCYKDMGEGVTWSPLFDRINEPKNGFWWNSATGTRDYAADERLSPFNPDVRSYTEVTYRLVRYIVSTGDEAFFMELLRHFSNKSLVQALATSHFILSDEALSEWVTMDPNRRKLSLYAANEDLPQSQARVLASFAADRIREAVDPDVSDRSAIAEYTRWLGPMERGPGIPSETLESILTLAESLPPEAKREVLIRELLHLDKGLDAEKIQRLYDTKAAVGAGVYLRHPNTPLSVLRDIARSRSIPSVRENLARRLWNSPDDELTSILARSDARSVKSLILAFGSGPGLVAVMNESEGDQRLVMAAYRYLASKGSTQELSPSRLNEIRTQGPASLEDAVASLVAEHKSMSHGWPYVMVYTRTLEALILLRTARDSGLTPEERTRLLASEDPQVRLLAITSVETTPDSRFVPLKQQRRIRRGHGPAASGS